MSAGSFYCQACGTAVKAGSPDCPSCGRSFLGVRCPQCGREGKADIFKNGCPDCGYMAEVDDPLLSRNSHSAHRLRGRYSASSYWIWSGILMIVLGFFVFLWLTR